MDILTKEFIEKWKALPELKCNYCGLVFKGEHQCDYEKLKQDNKRLREALVIAYSHCDDNEMDETMDVINMGLEGNDIEQIWPEELIQGYKALEVNK